MDPAAFAPALLAEVLYLRALGILRGRGVAVPRSQVVVWHLGLLLWLAALATPIAELAEELLSAHMAEHLLLADLGAPLLLAGARNPVLVFLAPRPILVWFARRQRLRAVLGVLRRPFVAIPVYAAVLYAWHFGFAFEAAVRDPFVHAFQHASFVGIGVLVWWAALEPQRRRPTGALWKIGHILGARLAGMFLGMSFVLLRVPVYTGVYASGDRGHGLDAITDQQLAGALMVTLDIAIMVFALAYFFFKAGQEEDRAPGA